MNKKTGNRCEKNATDGFNVCRFHGGSPNSGRPVTVGKYSKHLPKKIVERYETAEADPTLLSLHDDIAVTEALIAQKFESLRDHDSAANWTKAKELWDAMVETNDPQVATELRQLLYAGSQETNTWISIGILMEQKRKLSESEVKRLGQLQQFITAKEANNLLAAIINIIKTRIPDATTRSLIAEEIRSFGYKSDENLPARPDKNVYLLERHNHT